MSSGPVSGEDGWGQGGGGSLGGALWPRLSPKQCLWWPDGSWVFPVAGSVPSAAVPGRTRRCWLPGPGGSAVLCGTGCAEAAASAGVLHESAEFSGSRAVSRAAFVRARGGCRLRGLREPSVRNRGSGLALPRVALGVTLADAQRVALLLSAVLARSAYRCCALAFFLS